MLILMNSYGIEQIFRTPSFWHFGLLFEILTLLMRSF